MARIMQHWNFAIIFIYALNCVEHLWFNFGKSKLCSPNVAFFSLFLDIYFSNFNLKMRIHSTYVTITGNGFVCATQIREEKNWAFLSLSYLFVEIRNHDCVQFNKHTNYMLELFSSQVETTRERERQKKHYGKMTIEKKLNFRIAANAIIKSEY